MRWPWSKPKRPEIPPFTPRPPVEVHPRPKPEPGIEVEEVDTSAMTETGIHKAWKRLTGRSD